ncbi:unnamed protein product [Urochloa humidicola]
MAGRPPPPGFPSLSSFPPLPYPRGISSPSSGAAAAALGAGPRAAGGSFPSAPGAATPPAAWAAVATSLPSPSAAAAAAAAAAGLGMPPQAASELDPAAAAVDPAGEELDPAAAPPIRPPQLPPHASLEQPVSLAPPAPPLPGTGGAWATGSGLSRAGPGGGLGGGPGSGSGPGADTGPSAAQVALAAALEAVRAEAAAAEERVRAAALAWERERTAAADLAHQIAEAERALVAAGKQSVVQLADSGGSSSRQAPPVDSAPRTAAPDPLAAHLHLQAVGVQNIRSLVSVVLDTTSTSYARWREQVLLALTRYALESHVLVDTPEDARDVTWIRLDAVALSWIRGTLSLDLQDLVRTHGDTARHAWRALEGHFYGNAESRSARLDAAFRTFVQGDLTITQYCQHMKKMAEELTALGCPVSDRNLVIQVLRGLNPCYDVLKVWLPRQSPFPSFMKVWEDLLDDEVSRGLTPGSSSSSSTPSALAAASVLGAPPPGPSGGGGRGGGGGGGGGGRGGGGRGGGGHGGGGGRGGGGGGRGGGGRGGGDSPAPTSTTAPPSAPTPGGAPWPTVSYPWTGRISMWPYQTQGGGFRPQHQPAAMFAAPPPFAWTPPGPPAATPWPSPAQAWAPPAPTWPGGWDATALAQSFSTVGLTPPVTAEWVADTGASHYTTPDAGSGFPTSSAPM